MSKISFKAYFMNENSTVKEVRKFGVDADASRSFVSLREKLRNIFPQLHGRNFTITWNDDYDNITILSDEELEIALDEMSNRDSVIKLYLNVHSERERNMSNLPQIGKFSHPGIICDVCDKNINGFRFKCMECPDYDLCTDCLALGYHPEHYMVRMTEPLDWSTYQGRRLAHHMKKFVKKASGYHKDEERRCPYRNDKKSSCPAFSSGITRFDPSVIDSLANFVIDNCVLLEDCHEQKQTKEQRKEPSAETATEATEDPQKDATKHSFTQLLRMFEDNLPNIAQFLDPLGINVTVMTDNPAKNSKPADSTQTEVNPQNNASTSPEESAKKFPGEGKKLCDYAKASANNALVQKAFTPEKATEADEWTMVQHENLNASRASSVSSSINGAIPKQITPSAPVATIVEQEPKQPIYPPLPQECEYFHPNPKIQRAVEAMTSMGFTNEGGWLTHLLVSKDGDISKALDLLQPVRQQ